MTTENQEQSSIHIEYTSIHLGHGYVETVNSQPPVLDCRVLMEVMQQIAPTLPSGSDIAIQDITIEEILTIIE